LNSIPGYLIRGENGGVLTHVYRGHAIATDLKARFPSKRLPRHAMFGIQDYPVDVATRELRHYAVHTLLRPEADTRVVGFKEIRWHEEDSLGFVAFLQSTFPGARFVVNTRDLDEVSRSKWWAQRENARAELEETQAGLLRIADQLGDAAFHVHYNDYADSPETLRDLFDWLGEPFELDRVKAVLAERHSF
jgi:hypothetical protein